MPPPQTLPFYETAPPLPRARGGNIRARLRAAGVVFPGDPTVDRCSNCGYPQREHSYNGACYGLCGQFAPAIHAVIQEKDSPVLFHNDRDLRNGMDLPDWQALVASAMDMGARRVYLLTRMDKLGPKESSKPLLLAQSVLWLNRFVKGQRISARDMRVVPPMVYWSVYTQAALAWLTGDPPRPSTRDVVHPFEVVPMDPAQCSPVKDDENLQWLQQIIVEG
jgi:hypothetical protein